MESKSKIKKIVVIGPESTGKSTLCEQLATHFNTAWVREYAREYLEANGTDYGFEDLWKIARGQMREEEETVNRQWVTDDEADHRPPATHHRPVIDSHDASNTDKYATVANLLFIDTDLYVIKVWSEFVFNRIDNRILTHIAKREYDLYLLCDVELPWVKDNLREYPDPAVRRKLFHYYKEEMTEQKTPWVIISGNYEERLKQAINAVRIL